MFDSKKKEYIANDDEEYRGIRDLEYLLENVNENDEDCYKPVRVKNAFKMILGIIIILYTVFSLINAHSLLNVPLQ